MGKRDDEVVIWKCIMSREKILAKQQFQDQE